MPDFYLSDTRRIRDFGDGTCGVEYYDVATATWIAEKKPQTIYCDPWLLDITAVAGLNPAAHGAVGGTAFPYAQMVYTAAQEEYARWSFILPPNFDPDEDIIIRIFWKSSTAIVGDAVWGVSVLGREEGDDINAAAMGVNVQVVDTVPGVVEQLAVAIITLTPAQHVLAADDMVIVMLTRDGADVADTLVGDAHVVMVKADIAINPAVLIEGMP
ncbi:hypothetical protein ES703_124496 [subsurface metagenome]